jgi:hypothetical protein
MYFNLGTTIFRFLIAAIALSSAMTLTAYAQVASNQQMAFEGTLTTPSGDPIDLANKTLRFYVIANGCYLYGETYLTALEVFPR